jgi:ubiquinone/menaquinone biosynthesis C-methylase UbiE
MAWLIDVLEDETAALREVIDFRGQRVLEVGAGEGRLTWRFATETASVLAIDRDEERIEQGRAELPASLAERVQLEVMDAIELDVPRQSFDLALLSWSL